MSDTARPRRRRRTQVAAGIVVLAVLATLAGILLGGPGSHPAPAGQDPSRQARAKLATFTATVAPQTDLTSGMLTPAGDGWWAAVRGLAPDLKLPSPRPTEARWYAYTAAKAQQTKVPHRILYDAVHIGFADEAAARAYQPAGDGDGCVCATYRRGATVTVLPAYVSFDTEALPYAEHQPDLTVTRGAWRWDLAATVAARVAEAEDSDTLAAYYDHLGLGGATVTWAATSTDPAGPWVGTLTGFNAKKLDAAAAKAAFDATLVLDCAKDGSCQVEDEGLSAALEHAAVLTQEFSFGNPSYIPAQYPGRLPKDVVLGGGSNPERFHGFLDGSLRNPTGPLEQLTFSIDTDNEMTVHLVLHD